MFVQDTKTSAALSDLFQGPFRHAEHSDLAEKYSIYNPVAAILHNSWKSSRIALPFFRAC